jgi:hypothetical protein
MVLAARRLLKVLIEDAFSTEEISTTLTGDGVEARRAFVESNALGAHNLDVRGIEGSAWTTGSRRRGSGQGRGCRTLGQHTCGVSWR